MDLIAAVDMHWGIGKNGKLLFSLPEDMKFFKETTWGHTVVMGHTTLRSLPKQAPLKGRRNIVLSRDRSLWIEGAEVCHDFAELAALLRPDERVFLMGGASLYQSLVDSCERAFVTRVNAARECDVTLPDLDARPNWKIVEESEEKEYEGLTFRFTIYQNDCVKPLV